MYSFYVLVVGSRTSYPFPCQLIAWAALYLMTDFFEGHVMYVSATCKVRLFLRLRKWILVEFSLSNQVKRTDQALTLTLTLCGRIQSLVSSLHSHGTYTVNS